MTTTRTCTASDLRRETEWHAHAACRPSACNLGSAPFVPPVEAPGRSVGDLERARQATVEALVVCSACPVRDECGADADRNNINYGVWGGRVRGVKIEGLRRWGPSLRVPTKGR
jgi:hypothetical protein